MSVRSEVWRRKVKIKVTTDARRVSKNGGKVVWKPRIEVKKKRHLGHPARMRLIASQVFYGKHIDIKS